MAKGWYEDLPRHSKASKKGWIARRKAKLIKREKVRIVDSRIKSQTIRSLDSQEDLKFSSNIGDLKTTKLYIPLGGITQKEIKNLKNAFQKLPVSVQNEVKQIEINSNIGHAVKRGKKTFRSAGNWDNTTKTISVYPKSASEDFEKSFNYADLIITHEAGHGLFYKICEQKRNESKIIKKEVPSDLFMKLIKKYEAENERNLKEDKELIPDTYQKASNEIDDLTNKLAPITAKLRAFEQAGSYEGGITEYSSSYVKKRSKDSTNENFAECMNVWYSGMMTMEESNVKKENFPKTYKAFKALIESETLSQHVTFNYKPT